MLGYSKGRLPKLPYVNDDFFYRLAEFTGLPESVLRTRLRQWREGPRPRFAPQSRVRVDICIAGLGCKQCSYLKDGAVLTPVITQFDHVCLKHRTWAKTTDPYLEAGSAASSEAVAAALVFRRARRRRRPREIADAFNVSYRTLIKAVTFPVVKDLVFLNAAWFDRIPASRADRPSILEMGYPELALFTAVLLSPRCALASRGLRISSGKIIANPRAEGEFRQLAHKIASNLTEVQHDECIDTITNYLQEAAIEFLSYVTFSSITPNRDWSSEKVSELVDSLIDDRRRYSAGERY